MINKKILALLRRETGKNIQGIYRLVERERKKRGYAIRKETATYILAGDYGIDIAPHLDDDELAKVGVWRDLGKITSVKMPRKTRMKPKRKKTTQNVYGAGHAYEYYRDLQKIVKSARSDVCFVDAWLDDEIFNLYVDKLTPAVRVRILTKDPKSSFTSVAKKFKMRPGYSLDVRQHPDVHDRVFVVDGTCWLSGQSIKDAGKKMTYLIRFDNSYLKTQIDLLWQAGIVIV
jgi:hypothetical protein